MSFNTDEVNILVHRYLVESGYSHSAFTFFNEGGLDKTNLRAADVPPGALIAYLQKGLEYVSIEEHINEDGSLKQCEEPFTLITPHICSNLRKTEGRLRKAYSSFPPSFPLSLPFSFPPLP
ncbi:f-box-like wd repeat-containing protein tbl1xr1 [Nannochloropsis gaditana]|uniref:F-box-like wd repeat-containing protein tbl1xr1 n=1 Tax=Nannochloropsis gaditana TaxID=72520 RepID=W7TZ27_9STRA|nr:f-box-like wd repeat-containing protein tbl1xr1 [Nannochloropsis gaditana]